MNEKIVYPELSFSINGILFEVHNLLGRYTNEQQVCDMIEQKLIQHSLEYVREFVVPPTFEGEKSGRHRIDFLVGGVIVLEIKHKAYLTKDDYFQAKRYLAALDKKLAILVNFREQRLHPKRILNANAKDLNDL